MRIVYTVLLPNIAGGETVCLQIMRSARERGHTVCILVPSLGSVLETAQSEGFEAYIFPMERTFQFHKSFAFAKFLKKWKADLVHTHTALPGMVLARIGSFMANVPIVCHIHSTHFYSSNLFIRLFQQVVDALTSHFCKTFIAVSENTKSALENTGSCKSNILVIQNGISLDHNTDSVIQRSFIDLSIPQEHKIIGCVGRLDRMKGQHDLLRVSKILKQKMSNVFFIFIGSDPSSDKSYLHQLEAMVEEFDLREHVLFTGYRSDATQLMNAFDIFVLPSYREAMPLSILEAMAVGKPVVATAVNGVPEVVIDKQTGLLVAPGDLDALAEALLTLLQNPQLAHDMGSAGRRRVEEHFDIRSIHQRIFDLYAQVKVK